MMIWSESPHPRDQYELMASCLDDRIEQDSGIRVFDALLRKVNWEPWEAQYHQGGPGRPPHHPRLMCAAILYGLMTGIHSTRMLEHATKDSLSFQWLLDGRRIDHTTFAKFRTLHGSRIKSLFKEINRKVGRINKQSLAELVIDGSRLRADSDRHGARTSESLERRLEALEEQICEAVESLEKAETEGRTSDVRSCKQKKEKLEQSSKQTQVALEVAQERDKVKKAKEGKKSASVRVPVTDPDAHLLPNKEGGYAPNYTPVIAVDSHTGLIAGEYISEDNSESHCLEELVEQAHESFESTPKRVLADSNFGSGHELKALKEKGIETYTPSGLKPSNNPAERERCDEAVAASHWDRLPCSGNKLSKAAFIYKADEDAYYCPMGHALHAFRQQSRQDSEGRKISITEYKGAPCQGCPLASRCLRGNAGYRTITRDEYESLREEVAARMNSEEGKQIYARRAPCVEGVFGTIKAAMGIRRFNRRGLQKVREDWTWACLAYNMKKLMSQSAKGPKMTDGEGQKSLSGRIFACLISALSTLCRQNRLFWMHLRFCRA